MAMTTKHDPDAIPQLVQYEDNRNCACCRYIRYYGGGSKRITIECTFDGGPLWGAVKDPHPYPPGKTCCQLFVDEVLL
jgi:hypothetical protein